MPTCTPSAHLHRQQWRSLRLLLLYLLVHCNTWGLVHWCPMVTLEQRLPCDVVQHARNLRRQGHGECESAACVKGCATVTLLNESPAKALLCLSCLHANR